MIEFPKRRNSAQLYQSFPKEKNRRGERKSLPPAIPLLRATRSYWVPGQRRPWRRGGRRGRRGWRRASSGTWRRIASPWTPAAGRRRWSLSPPPGAPSPPPTTTRPPARREQHSLTPEGDAFCDSVLGLWPCPTLIARRMGRVAKLRKKERARRREPPSQWGVQTPPRRVAPKSQAAPRPRVHTRWITCHRPG